MRSFQEFGHFQGLNLDLFLLGHGVYQGIWIFRTWIVIRLFLNLIHQTAINILLSSLDMHVNGVNTRSKFRPTNSLRIRLTLEERVNFMKLLILHLFAIQ